MVAMNAANAYNVTSYRADRLTVSIRNDLLKGVHADGIVDFYPVCVSPAGERLTEANAFEVRISLPIPGGKESWAFRKFGTDRMVYGKVVFRIILLLSGDALFIYRYSSVNECIELEGLASERCFAMIKERLAD